MRQHGPGLSGVFLRHDPADLGLRPPGSADAPGYTAFGLTASDLQDARLTYQKNWRPPGLALHAGEVAVPVSCGVSLCEFTADLSASSAGPAPSGGTGGCLNVRCEIRLDGLLFALKPNHWQPGSVSQASCQ